MSHPEPIHDAPTAVATAPSPAPQGNGRLARRALLAAGTLVVCGGAAVATPFALQKAAQYTEDQVRQAFEAGAANARQALLNDLKSLEVEGEIISLDAAIAAANLTKLAVQYVVGPLATLLATIGQGALGILISALDLVLGGLNFIPGGSSVAQPLHSLRTTFATWQQTLSLVPKTLSDFTNWDTQSAEKYLKALQAKIVAEQNGSPTPTPTATSGY
jgi:hypothetical protein